MPRLFDLFNSDWQMPDFVSLTIPTHNRPLFSHSIQTNDHLRNRVALAAEEFNFLLRAAGFQFEFEAQPASLSKEGVR